MSAASLLKACLAPDCFAYLKKTCHDLRHKRTTPQAFAHTVATISAGACEDTHNTPIAALVAELLAAMPRDKESDERDINEAIRLMQQTTRKDDDGGGDDDATATWDRQIEEIQASKGHAVSKAQAARAASARHIGDAKSAIARANKLAVKNEVRTSQTRHHPQAPPSTSSFGKAPPKPGELATRFIPTSVRHHETPVADACCENPIIVWFRVGDLRLDDNPCLYHACIAAGAPPPPPTTTLDSTALRLDQNKQLSKSARRRQKQRQQAAVHQTSRRFGRAVVPVFVLPADEEEGGWPMGGATRYYLHQSLLNLSKSLESRFGWHLVCRRADKCGGSTAVAMTRLVEELSASALYYSRAYEPWHLRADDELHRQLVARGVECRAFNSRLLYEPWEADPDASDEACWNSGYGSVRFFLNGCHRHSEHPNMPLPIPQCPPPAQRPAPSVPSCGINGLDLVILPRIPSDATPNDAGLHPLNARQRYRRSASMKTHDWGRSFFSEEAWSAGEGAALSALDEFVLGEVAEATKELVSEVAGQATATATRGGGGGGGGGGGLTAFDQKHVQVDSREAAAPASCDRHRADGNHTSRLSPHLRFGEISPRRVYWAARNALESAIDAKSSKRHGKVVTRSVATFLRRLAWRDLAYWALWRFPHMTLYSVRPWYDLQWWHVPFFEPGDVDVQAMTSGDGLPPTSVVVAVSKVAASTMRPYHTIRLSRRRNLFQAETNAHLRAWQSGTTGYPLVDAAMKELWVTGYMNNYLRHVCAGFLVEYLGIDWRFGALWFHDTLLDADVAINSAMWQNGGHSGVDQWNFVMHPVYAAKACDPEGTYVRKWIPSLARLPLEFIHAPWEAPHHIRAKCRLRLGQRTGDYPERIVTDLDARLDHSVRKVVELRSKSNLGSLFMLPDGNDALPLPETGKLARAITRVDYKVMSNVAITKQTPAMAWDARRRHTNDEGGFAAVMNDVARTRTAGIVPTMRVA